MMTVSRFVFLMLFANMLCGCRTASPLAQNRELRLSWTNNLLTVTGPEIPGGKLSIWYLEAFCGSHAHDQSWDQTKIPHKTTLLRASGQGDLLDFETSISGGVEMSHQVRTTPDGIRFDYSLVNKSGVPVDIQWFQPACIRVADFTGSDQTNFIKRSFIFTESGLTSLADSGRTEEALYKGGQVYIPTVILAKEANPRPLASARPVNGLIGCFSADNKQLLATASDQTHELFEGVYVCLHSDPHVGGLKPGETKKFHAKIYLMPNNIPALLKHYHSDFPPAKNCAGVLF
jgi:hypothetical protein